MHMMNRKQYKRVVIALVALYLTMFAARVVYDLITFDDPPPVAGDNYLFTSLKETKNVASLRKEYEGGVQTVDQKYERVASVSARTVAYDDDLTRLNEAINGTQAVVQMDNEQGLEGGRRLSRRIGVRPEHFDACLAAVREVGVPISYTSQTTDKTYEYRQMLATRQELEKRLESYISLRSHDGGINEKINLEDKIIEVESQLLMLAVDLGEYSDENAFCTINVSLYEGSPVNAARKIWNAFMWTNAAYIAMLAGAAAVCITVVVLVKTYRFLGDTLTSDGKKKGGEE